MNARPCRFSIYRLVYDIVMPINKTTLSMFANAFDYIDIMWTRRFGVQCSFASKSCIGDEEPIVLCAANIGEHRLVVRLIQLCNDTFACAMINSTATSIFWFVQRSI